MNWVEVSSVVGLFFSVYSIEIVFVVFRLLVSVLIMCGLGVEGVMFLVSMCYCYSVFLVVCVFLVV